MNAPIPTLTITKAQLAAALTKWEQRHRDGGCKTREETAALSVEQVGQESADYLFAELEQAVEA